MLAEQHSGTTLLGIDIGTTHCKALLIDEEARQIAAASTPTPTSTTSDGFSHHDPDALWNATASLISQVTSGQESEVVSVGVASMAEAGMLLDATTGRPRTPILPWFDPRPARQAETLKRSDDSAALFRRSGLRPSAKYGLAKLLWLSETHPGMTRGAVWLSVADYVVWRLTGERVTDPTLAARTYAFDLGSGSWDEEWLDRFGFDAGLFPEVLPSGAPAGTVTTEAAEKTGLSTHTTASVAGHDHICALLGAGIVAPGHVLDSMGTAEAVLGVLDQLELGPNAVASGLAIAPHVVDGLFCWLGGAPSAGASVEWLRELLDGGIIDGDIDRLARAAGDGPTGVIFFPYLMGSGAPCPDPDVRAAFFGLSRTHGREHLVRSVLEGTAFEAESNRRAGIELAGSGEGDVVTVGGGARSVAWMQIKADLSGSPHCVPARQDATCTGAALAAGLRVGVFPDVDEAASLARRSEQYAIFAPDPERHRLYRAAYEERYLVVRESLHELSRSRSESHA